MKIPFTRRKPGVQRTKVFQAQDPGSAAFLKGIPSAKAQANNEGPAVDLMEPVEDAADTLTADKAVDSVGMRIDLSRIGGGK